MNVHVVLVRTEQSANIGSVARAIANMGGARLILVDPKCSIDEDSRRLAAGAYEWLDKAVRYSSWTDFYSHEGDGVRIALSRRGGKKRSVQSLDGQLEELQLGDSLENLYLFFGPEADGLNSEDIKFVNFTCHLPVYGEFASLNLSQAVLLALFMVQQKYNVGGTLNSVTGRPKPSVKPFYFPDQLIREWIEAMGFDVGARRASAYLTLRRLFLQNKPTAHELRVLEAILHQNIRKLKSLPSLSFATEKLAEDLREISR